MKKLAAPPAGAGWPMETSPRRGKHRATPPHCLKIPMERGMKRKFAAPTFGKYGQTTQGIAFHLQPFATSRAAATQDEMIWMI
jgi:hypothetical protein